MHGMVTGDELREIDGGVVATDGRATGMTRLSEWLQEHAAEAGRVYAPDLVRHCR